MDFHCIILLLLAIRHEQQSRTVYVTVWRRNNTVDRYSHVNTPKCKQRLRRENSGTREQNKKNSIDSPSLPRYTANSFLYVSFRYDCMSTIATHTLASNTPVSVRINQSTACFRVVCRPSDVITFRCSMRRRREKENAKQTTRKYGDKLCVTGEKAKKARRKKKKFSRNK